MAGILDPQLPGQVLHGLPRHPQWVLAQEAPDVADGADLHRHAQAVRVRTAQRDQNTVVIIEEEEALQLRARGHLSERPARLGLLISHKFHRHDRTVASTDSHPTTFPRTPAAPSVDVLVARLAALAG